ncbi:hypothetical protein AAHH79_40145, partial [Burkholderia pseudomallei]
PERLARLPDALRQRTLTALMLQAVLGAAKASLSGADAVAALIGYAQVRNSSKIYAGGSSMTGFLRRFSRPFGEQIAERS